ncbi:protein cueball-like isoform X1 [Phlebotomus papatasi]|uniref:protein cueball-like isoform X1 n=1 Tax=Phlebotomus papatasi TaxID=29031 RepID=UPI002483E1DE|nr:protein cueball-like isoform X1 [Phlebotomus papatasi]
MKDSNNILWICVLYYLSFFSNIISSKTSSWEFAVTTKNKIIFYDRNWVELTTAAQQFDGLSAIVYDETEDNIFFNDQEQEKGSIFLLKLANSDDNHIVRKIIQNVENEHVQGIAYDPLDRTLYWTDAKNHRIYEAKLGEDGKMGSPKIFLQFTEEVPRGISVDICRRKLYWTNSNYMNGSIERASLSGQKREVLITDVHMPMGIVVDYFTDKIFWLDNKAGNHFTVESASLLGSHREAIVTSLYNSPMNLVVDRDYIYWTEFYQESVWKVSKTASSGNKAMKVLSNFTSTPRGIVIKTDFLQNHMNNPVCKNVVKEIRQRLAVSASEKDSKNTSSTDFSKLQAVRSLKDTICLNKGVPNAVSGRCMCQNGFTGENCEVPLCYNYCVHGKCFISNTGYAECKCDPGYHGERCQQDVCTGFCLNGGRCALERAEPVCHCSSLYSGRHCEIMKSGEEICKNFCESGYVYPDLPWNMPQVCGDCSENGTISQPLSTERESSLELEDEKKIKIVWFILVSAVLTVLFLLNGICFFMWRFQKPVRPKIKKTYVVRKNLTPLTCRPSGAEQQCEITIENCCNMNVCDTPCFDPKALQEEMQKESRKDDKKKLLRHMVDTNGDLY